LLNAAASSVDGGLLVGAGIFKRFGALTVLEGVNFTLAPNEAVGIVGPNGAGKTTLLNVLAGTYRPSDGTVSFKRADVTTFNAADRCRLGIARSHQIPRPFGGMTVFENCLVAATTGGGLSGHKAYRCCVEALELCQMLHVANRRAETLGLLDRKRLELARALTTEPQVLVETVQELRCRGLAIVWIEHIVHVLLRVVERLVCMDAGRIIADGKPDVVIADAAVIDAYVGGKAVP
jgi:branched-chain amino acid transport system ATP-binding protein